MSRVDITLGLLAILGTVVVTALIGLGETARMPAARRGFEVRRIESGAAMFAQYCANCHGPNASGGVCPPLDATSGLHGGEIGPGVAWRLEELGWDPRQPYEYVYSVIESGRAVSTRPEQYPGNRTGENASAMAMPAWGQDYGGPLRPDQVADLASYVVGFRDAIATDATPRPRPTAVPTARTSLGNVEPITATTGLTTTEGVTLPLGIATGTGPSGAVTPPGRTGPTSGAATPAGTAGTPRATGAAGTAGPTGSPAARTPTP